MPDGMEVLTQKVEELTAVATRLDLSTHQLSWVLSDENVGLVKQVNRLASVVKDLEKSRDDHEKRIQDQEDRHKTEDDSAAEIRRPMISSFFSLVEKLIFAVISIALGWLLALRK